MCVLKFTLIIMGGKPKIFEHIAPAHEYREPSHPTAPHMQAFECLVITTAPRPSIMPTYLPDHSAAK